MNEEGNDDDYSYNADLLKMRLAFLAKSMPLNTVMERLRAVMLEKHQMDLDVRDRVLVQALLADIGGKEAGLYITSACEKRIEALSANVAAAAPGGLVRHSVTSAPAADTVVDPANGIRPQAHD
jgi:hypothetical protein